MYANVCDIKHPNPLQVTTNSMLTVYYGRVVFRNAFVQTWQLDVASFFTKKFESFEVHYLEIHS